MGKQIKFEINIPAPLADVWQARTSVNEKESGSLEKGEIAKIVI